MDSCDMDTAQTVELFVKPDLSISIKEEQCDDLVNDSSNPWNVPTVDTIKQEGVSINGSPLHVSNVEEEFIDDEEGNISNDCNSFHMSERLNNIPLTVIKQEDGQDDMYILPCVATIEQKDSLPNCVDPSRSHTCGICSKTYKKLWHLKKHVLETHTEAKRFTCLECGKGFNFKSDMKRHVKTHENQKLKLLERSEKKKQDNAKMEESESDRKSRPFICGACSTSYTTERHLKKHVLKKHTNQTQTEKAMVFDSDTEKPSRPFSCNLCSKTYAQQGHLNKHVLENHTNYRPEMCPECGKGFVYKSDLKKHSRVHVIKTKFPCTGCNKEFVSFRMLKEHMKHCAIIQKNGGPPYACGFCSENFETEHDLDFHVQFHKPSHARERVMCDICSKSFSALSIHSHKKIHTGELSTFPCKYCDKKFTKGFNMRRHIQIVHMNVKRFCCDKCGSQYNDSRNLIRHTKLKHAEHSCKYCGCTFNEESMLQSHDCPAIFDPSLQKKHGCKVCGKWFINRLRLFYHIISHTT